MSLQEIPPGRAALVASLVEPPSVDGGEVAGLAGVADVLEVRADRAGDLPADWLRARFPGRLLYTLRSAAEGGGFAGPREERRRRLIEAAGHYDLVDLEGDRDLAIEVLDRVSPERRVVSWHGVSEGSAGLPALRARFDQLAETPAALYKMVAEAAHSGEDLLPLALLADLGRRDVVAFASGGTGTWTRLVAPRIGAPVVFAAAGTAPAAPGQPSLARLRRDYGLPDLPPVRFLCGVVGQVAARSLSPRLHNAAYRALGLPFLYVPFDVEHFGDFWLEVVETDLPARLGFPLAGLSVTAPHKDVAFAVAGATSPLAQRLQACNTLTPRDGVWEGESTDAEGVVEALRRRGVDPRGRVAAVLGCGGAGRAAALGLTLAGAKVVLVNRGAERGLAAAKSLGLPFVLREAFEVGEFDLLVHATPLGRAPADELPFPVEGARAGAAVVDLVYGEEPTPLVAEAARRGLLTIDGREVLLRQAVPQFRAMTGRELPVAVAATALGLDGGAR